MKPSPLELLLSLAASASMLLAVFHQPLGLSDVWEWGALILVFVFLIPLLILQRRRRKAPVTAPPTPAPSAPLKRVFWLVLVLLLVTSLSGPLWLPYTGVPPSFNTRHHFDRQLHPGRRSFLIRMEVLAAEALTNHWSQPLAVVKSTLNFMKQFSIFATLAPTKRWLICISLVLFA